MLVQVWRRKSGEDGEGGREGVSRFLRAAAAQPQAMLPLQVTLTPSPEKQTCARWEIAAEPSGVSLAAGTVAGPPRTEDWQFQMDDLKIEQRCGWCGDTRNLILLLSLSREKEVSVLWTITQSCIEDYKITLCPQHHQVGISQWEIKSVSLKESATACWIGNFSRPNLKNEDDFLVEIQLTNLNDFDFHFEDCKVFKNSYLIWNFIKNLKV